MKNISLIKISLVVNLLLVAAVVFLFMKHYSIESILKDDVAENVADSLEVKKDSLNKVKDIDLKIVYVDTDTLWESFYLVKELRDEMAAEKLKMEGRYSAELKKLEKEVMDFQEKARYMTQTEGQQKQQELMQKEQELIKLEERLNQEFVKNENKRNERIQQKIKDFLKKYSRENGYSYILGYSFYNNVLHADTSLDITNEVLLALNEEYGQEKQKSEE